MYFESQEKDDKPYDQDWFADLDVRPEQVGTCHCPEIGAHEAHVWDEYHIGLWWCPGSDGSVKIGDRRWFYSLSYRSPMTRHKIVLEVKEYGRGGTFLCEIVDNDGHPELDTGYFPVYRDWHDIVHDREMDS
jgi:hypothetical protein